MSSLNGALLAIALCSGAAAAAQSHLDLALTPGWGGWARPGRSTELDVRVSSDVATRDVLTVTAGRQTLQVPIALEPSHPVRLHIPVSSLDNIEAVAAGVRKDVAISRSESPLLAVALQSGETVEFAGFHAVALAADALPRNASAYAAVDALIIDASSLAALDDRQARALVSDAAQCGRIVVVNPDVRVRDVLQRAAGCGGRTVVFATSLPQGLDGLRASLETAVPSASGGARPMGVAGVDDVTWRRVIVLALVCFIAMVFALWWSRAWPAVLATPVLAAAIALATLHVLAPVSSVVIWSESESGAHLARYRAWQSLPGTWRGHSRAQLLAQLASPASCDPGQPWLLEVDANSGQPVAAEFDTRLFRAAAVCYAGELPSARTVELIAGANGAVVVRNAGAAPWPPGMLIVGERVLDLPALDPGKSATLSSAAGTIEDGALRMARQRAAAAKAAALWKLAATDSPAMPAGAIGWLLVAVPAT